MQSDKLTDKDNPAASGFPLTLENNGFGLSVGCDGGAGYNDDTSLADPTSFRQLPLPVNHFPGKDSASRMIGMPDNMKLNVQQVPQDITSNTSWNLNPWTNAFPQQVFRGTQQQISAHNSASSFMNADVSARRFPNPQASRNTMPMIGSSEEGYQFNRQFARPQSNEHLSSIQRRFLSRHYTTHPQLKAETDAKANMDGSGSLEKIDGRFLSLGPESNINRRSSRYIRHGTRSSSSMVQNPGVRVPNSQESGSGLSKPAPYMGGLCKRNEAKEFCIASTELSSRPFHILQTPEINIQQNMLSMPNNRISISESNRDPKYDKIQGNNLASSAENSSNSTTFPFSGQNRVPSVASRSDDYTGTVTGVAPFQLHKTESAQRVSLKSLLYSRALRNGESGVQHGHSGSSFDHEITLDDAAARILLPDNNQFQTNDSRPAVMKSGVFPKRLGVQDYAQVPEGSSIPTDRGVRAAGRYRKSFNDLPARFYRDLHTSFAYGQSPCVPVQPRANYGGPLTADGQGVAKVNEGPQNCELLNRPSLKRGAIQSPPDATAVHRKKLAHNPIAGPSMPYRPIHPSLPNESIPPASFKPKNAPALLPTATTAHPLTPALPHIRWQGIDDQPEPTGDKCLICKRDLIFSPEGPVEWPPIFPPVAVLPCGHTFHDHCLQKITPEDQSKSPACIPCAIGEN